MLFGPRTGRPVKCDSSVMRLARRHRSSIDSPRLGDGPSGGAAAGLPDDSADMVVSPDARRSGLVISDEEGVGVWAGLWIVMG